MNIEDTIIDIVDIIIKGKIEIRGLDIIRKKVF